MATVMATLTKGTAMDEREELADILMSDELDNCGKFGRDYAFAEADAILAAGYRKIVVQHGMFTVALTDEQARLIGHGQIRDLSIRDDG